MHPIKIGIIGSGVAAKRIYSIIKELDKSFKIEFYSNTRKYFFLNRKKIILKKFNFNSKDIEQELFFIANNTSLHFKYLNFLLTNNIPVYVEKPICTTDKEIKILINSLKKFKKKLSVGYQFRENNCLKYLKKKIKLNRSKIINVMCYSGENVKKYHKYENYLNSYTVNKNKGGGVLLTQSHQIDVLTFLFGDLICHSGLRVDRDKNFRLNSNVETNVTYILKSSDNIPICCNLNYFGLTKTHIQISFENEILTWNNNNSILIEKRNSKHNKNIFFMQTRNNMYKKKIEYFVKNMSKKNTIKENREIIKTIKLLNEIKSKI